MFTKEIVVLVSPDMAGNSCKHEIYPFTLVPTNEDFNLLCVQ